MGRRGPPCTILTVVASVGLIITLFQCTYFFHRNISFVKENERLHELYKWIKTPLNETSKPKDDDEYSKEKEEEYKKWSQHFNETNGQDWDYNLNVSLITAKAAIGISGVALAACGTSMVIVRIPPARKCLFFYVAYMPVYLLALAGMHALNCINFDQVHVEYTAILGVTVIFCFFVEVAVLKRYKEMGEPQASQFSSQGTVCPPANDVQPMEPITYQRPVENISYQQPQYGFTY